MKKFFLLLFTLVSTISFAQTDVHLSSREKKELNTFFSNFSEANVESFSSATLSDEIMLQFALRHNYMNKFKSLKKSKDGLSSIISRDLVDMATEKYFGRKITFHKSKEYLVPMADGEAYLFSQIRRLIESDGETFKAEGEIFSASSGSTADAHGTYRDWKKAGEEVERIGKFEAIIKRSAKDKDRYVLLQYHISSGNP